MISCGRAMLLASLMAGGFASSFNACALVSATGDYQIAVWTAGDQGLRNSSVTGVAQTPDGYLWVGTYNGLARFDGQRFVTFDPANTPVLQRARVRRLISDPTGTLWINTHDGSLTSYRNGQFALEWLGDGSPDGVISLVSMRSNRLVFLLNRGELIRTRTGGGTNRWELLRPPAASPGELAVEDGEGVIWGRGRDQRLWRLVGSAFELVPANGGLTGTSINSLVADAQGRVWAGTDREIARWDGGRFVNVTPTNGEPVVNATFLCVLPDGDFWAIANERVRKARGREWVFEAEAARGVFTGWRDRTGLHADASGGVWLYDYNRGIFHIRADGRVRQLTGEENFPGERVDCFYEDREGNLWAGVDRGGLVRIREKRFAVLTPGEASSEKAAVCVTEDREGAIWVGTFGGGLHRWQDNVWRTFSLPGGSRRGFVFSLYPEREGGMWTSAGDEDLHLGQEGNYTLITPTVHGVKALLQAGDGRLWVGKKSGLGYLAEGQFRQLTPEDGIERNDVRALAEDANGVLWAGTGDGTLYRISSNRISSFRHDDAFGSLPIWSLLADADGVVWVGTFRGGLMRFCDGRFTRFTTKQGLPDDVICQILDDGAGRLWVGTQQGLFQVAKAELSAFNDQRDVPLNLTAYGRYDGLPSLEFSGGYQPAAWRTRDGRLLFATLKGVVVVQPGEITVNTLPPLVVIEETLVDGQRQSPATAENTALPRLEVSPGKQQLEFHFTGLSFVSPDRVRFRYQLEGLDKDWIEAGTRRSAQYSFLRPSEYCFRVLASNNDGVWSEQPASMTVVVLPRFFETWWFRAAAVLGTLGVVIFAVRKISGRRLRRQLEQLERQRAVERDRTRIAKDIHDDLGAGLTHIALLSELARRDTPQELPNHVAQISEMARELTRNMDEIVWAVDPQNDTLDSLVTYVSKFAQDYLSVAGIRCRLDLPAELPPLGLPAEVRHNLFLAIKEALNNVVKHARATEVWLHLVVDRDAFTLVIEDNGCGLHSGNGRPNGNGARGDRIASGHGLANMERRLSSIGGYCAVKSVNGRGTRAELRVTLATRRSPELVTG